MFSKFEPVASRLDQRERHKSAVVAEADVLATEDELASVAFNS